MLISDTEIVLASTRHTKRWPIWHSGTVQLWHLNGPGVFVMKGLYDKRRHAVRMVYGYWPSARAGMEKVGWVIQGRDRLSKK